MTSHTMAMKAVAAGILAFGLLLGVYFGVLTLVSGWEFTLGQFATFWHFMVALVGQYQVGFFWVGLAFNLAGVLYISSKVVQASWHMAQMAQGA